MQIILYKATLLDWALLFLILVIFRIYMTTLSTKETFEWKLNDHDILYGAIGILFLLGIALAFVSLFMLIITF